MELYKMSTVFGRLVACTINIYDRRFYYHNDIGLYYNTLETIVIDDPSLSLRHQLRS
jgi:hypothetical protein